MNTVEEILEAIRHLPTPELEKLRQELPTLINGEQKPAHKIKPGEAFRKLAGAAHVGKVLIPLPSREELYEEDD
jgi:hypothetical protein